MFTFMAKWSCDAVNEPALPLQTPSRLQIPECAFKCTYVQDVALKDLQLVQRFPKGPEYLRQCIEASSIVCL